MKGESSFLDAIQKDRRDETLRLVYADWLEERDAVRATYLRVESELRRTWSYENQRRDLATEMSKLRSKVDQHWLSQVRLCTTPPPPLKVEKFIPELTGKSKPTYLLHPRPGSAPQDVSKVGGVFLWPKKEPWPTCPEHDDCPLVPALQVRKRDIPRITKFKGKSDLLQVLWCPHDHEDSGYCVHPQTYWRRVQSVKDPVEEHPEPTSGESWYLPKPCVLIPERVKEYPNAWEFSIERFNEISVALDFQEATEQIALSPEGSWNTSTGIRAYFSYLSVSDSTKIGGHPGWVQSPWYPNCQKCKQPMEHLLSFGSLEYDGGTWGRWIPIEERDTLTSRYDVRKTVQCAPDWSFGDAGTVYIFVCRNCKDWPIQSSMQCS